MVTNCLDTFPVPAVSWPLKKGRTFSNLSCTLKTCTYIYISNLCRSLSYTMMCTWYTAAAAAAVRCCCCASSLELLLLYTEYKLLCNVC